MSPMQRYLEDMSFEDVVAQLHGLLPVQLPLLPGQHEGHEGVAAPGEQTQAMFSELPRECLCKTTIHKYIEPPAQIGIRMNLVVCALSNTVTFREKLVILML